eukprot:COSAG01_NODE_11863_length_1845_cov_1.851088_2_plen_536_part_01
MGDIESGGDVVAVGSAIHNPLSDAGPAHAVREGAEAASGPGGGKHTAVTTARRQMQMMARKVMKEENVVRTFEAAKHEEALAEEELLAYLREYTQRQRDSRSKLNHAAEVVKAGSSRRAAAIRAALDDVTEEHQMTGSHMEAIAQKFTPELSLTSALCSGRSAWSESIQPFAVMKRRVRVAVADVGDSLMELYNESTDVLFLVELSTKAQLLFFISAIFIALNLLGRLFVVLAERRDVDEGKGGTFWRGAALYMLEPNSGMRMMKRTLKKKAAGGQVYVQGEGYVTGELDAVAVQARNDVTAGEAEVKTVLVLVMTQDVPEFVIQLVYLFFYQDGSGVGILFWLTVFGTVIHLIRQGLDAFTTWSQLPRLRRMAEGRDKTFVPEETTDATVRDFAQRCGGMVRSVNLKDCAGVTDEAFVGTEGLVASCPHVHTLVASDCPELSDATVLDVASSWALLHTIQLNRCTHVSNAGMEAIVRDCGYLRALWLAGCAKITDIGAKAVGEGCSKLESLSLNDCVEVTDDGVVAVGRGCPDLK